MERECAGLGLNQMISLTIPDSGAATESWDPFTYCSKIEVTFSQPARARLSMLLKSLDAGYVGPRKSVLAPITKTRSRTTAFEKGIFMFSAGSVFQFKR